ncbi:MAG: hypothetical protein TECD_00359 [Hyphomicrobiaceae bacterium hypho_1]
MYINTYYSKCFRQKYGYSYYTCFIYTVFIQKYYKAESATIKKLSHVDLDAAIFDVNVIG